MDSADAGHNDRKDSFKCDKCEKVFNKSYYLYKHYRRLHKIEPTVKKTLLCPVPDCEEKTLNNEQLRNHIESHGIPIESENLFFPSIQDFEKWKDEIETDNKASYLLKKTCNMADGSIKSYFWCNRSGSKFPSKSKMKRAPRAKGSRRINAHCPSTLEVIQGAGDIKVIYHKTHVGHDLELKYVPINNATKEAFACKYILYLYVFSLI